MISIYSLPLILTALVQAPLKSPDRINAGRRHSPGSYQLADKADEDVEAALKIVISDIASELLKAG
jgi:hypothetical protein